MLTISLLQTYLPPIVSLSSMKGLGGQIFGRVNGRGSAKLFVFRGLVTECSEIPMGAWGIMSFPQQLTQP